jgi:hypothetical protein
MVCRRLKFPYLIRCIDLTLIVTSKDPVARREIWQMVSDLVSDDNVPDSERTSVILTTHSMDECEVSVERALFAHLPVLFAISYFSSCDYCNVGFMSSNW